MCFIGAHRTRAACTIAGCIKGGRSLKDAGWRVRAVYYVLAFSRLPNQLNGTARVRAPVARSGAVRPSVHKYGTRSTVCKTKRQWRRTRRSHSDLRFRLPLDSDLIVGATRVDRVKVRAHGAQHTKPAHQHIIE